MNLPAGKNLVGAFYQPRMVAADLTTLKSQSSRELGSGWAEAIKHGLILDPSLYRLFEERVEDLLDLEPEITEEVCGAAWPSRAALWRRRARDAGPAHAPELRPHHRARAGGRHGVRLAVARGGGLGGHGGVGEIGHTMGLISREKWTAIPQCSEASGLPLAAPGVDPDAVLEAMKLDKKASGRRINWVLLEGIGRAVVRSDVPDELAEATVRAVCSPDD